MLFAPDGTITFKSYSRGIFILYFKFACNWAVFKKLVTGFAQILISKINLHLFGSYLPFKSLCKYLGS